MALAVSTAFKNAQVADINTPAAKVQLMLGNYFNASAYGATIASNGDDASGNYPAAGAIDGDRTEINVGAASGADNGIGLSSWRSAANPSGGSPATLTITLKAAQSLNRIKLYHLSTDSLTSYDLEYFNGTSWIVFAATSGIVMAGQVSIPTTGTLDVVNFPTITATQWRLSVYGSTSGHANVVEIEGYQLVDITARVKSVKVSRQRDYKIANPMAAKVTLDCINTDQFFSINYTPTPAQTAAGFVNSQLLPNAVILVTAGFFLTSGSSAGSPELVPSITAYMDSITVKPLSRTAVIEGRDGVKGLINLTDSSNLKTNADITTCIQYVLNRANLSSFECSLNTTGVTIPYFFTDQEDILSTVRNLTQAAGDALFWFDENGIATFRYYTADTPEQWLYPSQTDWNLGSFTGNVTKNASDQLDLQLSYGPPIITCTDPNSIFIYNPSIQNNNSGAVNGMAQSIRLPFPTQLSNVTFTITYSIALNFGLFFHVWADNGGSPGTVLYSQQIASNSSGTTTFNLNLAVTLAAGNYWIGVDDGGTDEGTISGFYPAFLGNQSPPLQNPPYLCLGVFDAGPTAGQWTLLQAWVPGNFQFRQTAGNIFMSFSFDTAAGSGTWQSPVHDMGAGVVSLGQLQMLAVPSGGTISAMTRTSANGISGWSPYVALSSTGNILSPVNEFIQFQIFMAVGITTVSDPLVLNVTLNWTGGSGNAKYPPKPSSWTFSFASNLLNVSQELADNLGGDSSILNDVIVNAQPYVLQGASTDVVWQGTIGTPPVNISAGVPLSVTSGQTLIYPLYISGGMDIGSMSGANPAAATITFAAGGAGSWSFTTIHPTLPVLQIVITGTGTITNLQVLGKTFSSGTITAVNAQIQSTTQGIEITSKPSIASFGRRKATISNPWIVSAAIATNIAQAIINNFANPFSYIPSVDLQFTPAAQVGDRVTVIDQNTALNNDYLIVGLDHEISVQEKRASIQTTATLLLVPAGY